MIAIKPSLLLVVGLLLLSCNESGNKKKVQSKIKTSDNSNTLEDIREIQSLIRNVYMWHDGGNPTTIGMVADLRDSLYIGYNLKELHLATRELKESEFFTDDFIENHAKIHLAVDNKLKKKEIEWLVGGLPNYGSGAEPWCNCQDTPYDLPNPWRQLKIKTIHISKDSGEFYWKWRVNKEHLDSGWSTFNYHFKVRKIDEKWKIDFLEGLNLEDFTRKH